MTAYFKENQSQYGWTQGSWSKIYTAFDAAAWTNSGYTYCSIMADGKYMHPGKTAGAVLTFTVPAGGTVSYPASLYAYGGSNNPSKQGNAWGTYVTLWINDRQVYPASFNSESNKIGSHNTSESNPLSVSYSSFRVSAGDKIRLCVSAAGGSNSSKGTCLIDLPTVTYHQADVSIADSSSNHTWSSWTDKSSATCTEDGLRIRTCSECKTKEHQTVTAFGHDYGTWTVLSEATCKANGEQRRICSTCREQEYQTILAKEHVFGSWGRVSGSCTQDGAESRFCSVCQHKETRNVAATGHSWGTWTVTKAPTNTTTGTETATCGVCGESQTRTLPQLTGGAGSAATSDDIAADNTSSDQSVAASTATDSAGNASSVPSEDSADPSGTKNSQNAGSDPAPKSPEESSFPWWIVITAECVIIVGSGVGVAYFLLLRKKKLAAPKATETTEDKTE